MTPSRRAEVQARRQCVRDEASISSVIGAILMFGLLVVTLAVIQIRFVPVWDKQRERDSTLEVSRQAASIKADLDRIAVNQTIAPLTEPVSLSRERGFSFFGNQILPGEVRFTPTAQGAGMTVSTPRPVAMSAAGGTPLYGINEDWSWTGTSITNVMDIVHMRMRIPNPGGLPTGTQTLIFTVTDVNGMCAGQVRLVATGTTATSKAIDAQVYPAQVPPAVLCSASAADTDQTFIGTATPPFYYHEPLSADSQFSAVLAAIPASRYPVSVAFTQGNTAGQVSLVYDQSTVFGRTRSGSGGLVFSSFNQALPTGTLSIHLNHNRLPPQTYAFEYGAIFLRQPTGAAMVAPPGFSIASSGSQASLAWAFPQLSGGSAAVTGAPSATVSMFPSAAGTGFLLAASDLTITIATQYPEAWVAFWQERMALAGLTSTATSPVAPCTVTTPGQHFTTASTATTATLTFNGPCSGVADATRDVLFNLQAGGATVELRAAG